MATLNGKHRDIKKVLVVGDNRSADSILSGLIDHDLGLHQAAHVQSTLESNTSITIHKIDSSAQSLSSLLQQLQPDILFSTQSAGSFSYQKHLIDTGIQCNIPRFVLAEFGHDCLNENTQERLPPYKERAKVVEYLQDCGGEIEWTGVATGCHLEHALSSGNIGFDLKWQSATIHGTGDEEFAASSEEWIGRVALALVTHWEGVKNQYLHAAGMITSANELLQSLQKITGQKWEKGNMEVEEVVREAERRFERGFPDAGIFLLERTVLFDEELGGVRAFVERDAKARLGLEGEKLEVVIEKVVHDAEHDHGKGGCGCD